MTLSPIAFIAPNYRDFTNYWLKAYEQGTTTPKVMALDADGVVTVAKLELNDDGFLESAGGALVIAYVDGAYDLFLFPTEAEADANDTTNAEQLADNIVGSLTEDDIETLSINDLSKAHEFASVSAYKAFTTAFPVGKIVNLLDRLAEFTVISGTGTGNDQNIIASDQVAQSIDINIIDVVTITQLGAIRNDSVQDAIVQDALDFMEHNAIISAGLYPNGGVDGGTIHIPQGIRFVPENMVWKKNVTIIQNTGTDILHFFNGENAGGAVNETKFTSGFHTGLILNTHNNFTIDTLAPGQVLSNRTSLIYSVNGSDTWQLANDIAAEGDDGLTLQALNSSKQTMHWHHNGSMRYGRMDSIQDFSTPVTPHVFNKAITHQDQEGANVTHIMQIVSAGVKDVMLMTGATQANPVVITTGLKHGMINGRDIHIENVVGMTDLNGGDFTVANVTDNTFELAAVDGTSFGAYTAGGSVTPQVLHQKIIQLLGFDGELTIRDDSGANFIFRLADDGTLKLTKGIVNGRFTTIERNALTGFVPEDVGLQIWDTDLVMPIWLRTISGQWVDAASNIV